MLRGIRRLARQNTLSWRWAYNFGPTVKYKLAKSNLSPEASRVVADLNRDGVAITSVEALLGTDSSYDELVETVNLLQDELSEEVQWARNQKDGPRKSYSYYFFGQRPNLDPNSIFTQFALQEQILGIANAYYGMYTKLRYYNVWHNFMTDSEARESQLWHKDYEDKYTLKLFLNLVDVDERNGAFVYAPVTHPKGSVNKNPEYTFDGGRRSSDSQMSNVLSDEKWISCAGPKGTIIFADTEGYHKGGLAREHDRLVYTCMFGSQIGHDLLKHPVQIPTSGDAAKDFALSAMDQRQS